MTETTFERAVKAVALSDGFTAKELSTMRGDPRLDPTPEYEGIVRAVLQAIREPDDVTAEAGWLNGEHTLEGMGPDFPSYVESCRSIFTAMIDAILSQSQEGKHP
jgi:hypothetical protein